MGLFDDTRADWNAGPRNGTPVYVPPAKRTEFYNHYDGGEILGLLDADHDGDVDATDHARCLARVRDVQRFHIDGRGWVDIGYNGLVCPHGRAIEGRGIDYSGAHCSGHNTSAYGIQFMVGGAEVPTPAAYARMRTLYNACTQRSEHYLDKRGHRDGYATECPGDGIYAWVKAGMPYPNGTAPVPAPAPATTAPVVTVDGALGAATIRRWQGEMGTPVDGVISEGYSNLTAAVQRFLNAKGMRDKAGRVLTVDGAGLGGNLTRSYGPTRTVEALQRWLGTPMDGVLSHPESTAVKALQRWLNAHR